MIALGIVAYLLIGVGVVRMALWLDARINGPFIEDSPPGVSGAMVVVWPMVVAVGLVALIVYILGRAAGGGD